MPRCAKGPGTNTKALEWDPSRKRGDVCRAGGERPAAQMLPLENLQVAEGTAGAAGGGQIVQGVQARPTGWT